MSNQTAENMDLTAKELEEYNYWVGMRQALERLESNPDFTKVILDGYFKDYAVNSVARLASPVIKQRGQRPDIMEMLIAVSQLQHFFMDVKNLGAEPEEFTEDETEVEEE